MCPLAWARGDQVWTAACRSRRQIAPSSACNAVRQLTGGASVITPEPSTPLAGSRSRPYRSSFTGSISMHQLRFAAAVASTANHEQRLLTSVEGCFA
jgi:hypothetical protein